MDLATIIQGGAVGLAAGLILLVAFIIKKVFCLMNNHITSNTKATNELAIVIAQLKTWLRAKNGNK